MDGGHEGDDFRCNTCFQSGGQHPIAMPCGHLFCHSCSCAWPVYVCPVCDIDSHPRPHHVLITRSFDLRLVIASGSNFILKNLCHMYIILGKHILRRIVKDVAEFLMEAVDRRFPPTIFVNQERDNTDGSDGEGGSGDNDSAGETEYVMGDTNGEGSQINNVLSETGEVRSNVNGLTEIPEAGVSVDMDNDEEGNQVTNGSSEEAEMGDNGTINGDGSSLTLVLPS